MTLTHQNIEPLLLLCKQGNRLAQLEVYNRYQKAMYNVAFRILKNTAEAEDMMQESFITAFNKLENFKGESSFGFWLKRIVVNNSISMYKKSKRFVMVSEEELAAELDQNDFEIEEDYSKIKVEKALQCLDELQPSYRQVLTLHLIEGYDHEELCEILNISYANCRTLISRAKNSLRKKLVSYEK